MNTKWLGRTDYYFARTAKTKVILRAGNIREPYFAHVDSERKCEYNIEKANRMNRLKEKVYSIIG